MCFQPIILTPVENNHSPEIQSVRGDPRQCARQFPPHFPDTERQTTFQSKYCVREGNRDTMERVTPDENSARYSVSYVRRVMNCVTLKSFYSSLYITSDAILVNAFHYNCTHSDIQVEKKIKGLQRSFKGLVQIDNPCERDV